MKRIVVLYLLMTIAGFTVAQDYDVTHDFVDNTLIYANQVNQNFQDLVDACNNLKGLIEGMAVGLWSEGTSTIFYNGGLVGIGTANPVTSLHIDASTGPALLRLVGTGDGSDYAAIQMGDGTNFWSINHRTDLTNEFSIMEYNGASWSHRLTIENNTGNVGIGTTSPGGTLHVKDPSALVTAAIFEGEYGRIYMEPSSSSTENRIVTLNADATATKDLWISGMSGTNLMTIKANGSIGIGTNSPAIELDTVGTIRALSAPFNPPSSGTGVEIFYASNEGPRGVIVAYDRGSAVLKHLDLVGDPVTLTGGNVGIGVVPNYNLDVSGDINFTGNIYQNGALFGGSGLWADQGTYINPNNASNVAVTDTGKIGIGTTSPGTMLEIDFSGTTTADGINIENIDGNKWGLYSAGSSHATSPNSFGIWQTGHNFRLVISDAGNVGIGTTSPSYLLTVNGQPAANGYTQFTNYSDIRLKENITPIGNMLTKILALNPVTFAYNDVAQYADVENTFFSGFIAQELIECFPEMVGVGKIDETEYYDSNLSSLPIYLVKAVQEQQAIIEQIMAHNDELLERIEALEAKLK